MALRAGLGHLGMVDRRGRLVHRTNAVRLQIEGIAVRLIVAGNAGRHSAVSPVRLQLLAVTAGPVLGKLIGPRRRIETPHVLDVGVATAAEVGNVGRRLDRPEVVLGLVGLDLGDRRIAAVTILAAQPLLPMHVVLQGSTAGNMELVWSILRIPRIGRSCGTGYRCCPSSGIGLIRSPRAGIFDAAGLVSPAWLAAVRRGIVGAGRRFASQRPSSRRLASRLFVFGRSRQGPPRPTARRE